MCKNKKYIKVHLIQPPSPFFQSIQTQKVNFVFTRSCELGWRGVEGWKSPPTTNQLTISPPIA